jgi:hypothetical protein
MTAGTNVGAVSAALITRPRRASRRHVNNCWGESPCRRAMSEITAPGANVSPMIRALSSSEKRRRRPVPVITSSRRRLSALGSSVWSSVDTSRSPIQRSTILNHHHLNEKVGSRPRLRSAAPRRRCSPWSRPEPRRSSSGSSTKARWAPRTDKRARHGAGPPGKGPDSCGQLASALSSYSPSLARVRSR